MRMFYIEHDETGTNLSQFVMAEDYQRAIRLWQVYWSSEEQRVLFSCDVNMDDIRMESDIDWRTKAEAPITNYKFLRNL